MASFFHRKAGTIELALDYIDLDLAKRVEVTIQFCGVSEVALDNLSSDNVMDEISFAGTEPYTVTLESCYGLSGQFKCKSIAVISFKFQNDIVTDKY